MSVARLLGLGLVARLLGRVLGLDCCGRFPLRRRLRGSAEGRRRVPITGELLVPDAALARLGVVQVRLLHKKTVDVDADALLLARRPAHGRRGLPGAAPLRRRRLLFFFLFLFFLLLLLGSGLLLVGPELEVGLLLLRRALGLRLRVRDAGLERLRRRQQRRAAVLVPVDVDLVSFEADDLAREHAVAGEAHAHRVADGEVAQRVRVHVHARGCSWARCARDYCFPPSSSLRRKRAQRAQDCGFRRRCKECSC